MSVRIGEGDALIVVDVQNDFCPGGALPVPQGDQVVPVINRIAPLFPFVVATQDWHPPHHVSFRERGGPWPPHCLQGSRGAEFHPHLNVREIDVVVQKATQPDKDAYSGFEGTNLEEILRENNIRRVFITGLATDYCVRATALDALKAGFETFIVTDAVRGVDAEPGDSERALREVEEAGGALVNSQNLEVA